MYFYILYLNVFYILLHISLELYFLILNLLLSILLLVVDTEKKQWIASCRRYKHTELSWINSYNWIKVWWSCKCTIRELCKIELITTLHIDGNIIYKRGLLLATSINFFESNYMSDFTTTRKQISRGFQMVCYIKYRSSITLCKQFNSLKVELAAY